MPFVERIGYVAIVYFGCQISFYVLTKLFRSLFFRNKSVDLSSLGKWAIVTGCTQGIGKAFVEVLASKDLNIILVTAQPQPFNVEQDSILNIAKKLESLYNIKTKVIYLNPSQGLEAYKIIEKEIVALEVGVLVNNFGQNNPHPEYFLDLPHNDKIYMNIVQSNIVVTTNMCRIVLPQMALRQKGVIINVSSSLAVIPSPLLTVYAATKAYILKFSKGLHMEYSKYGIIIQCLLPVIVSHSRKDCSISSSWISPTPEQYVENAIETVGKDEITTGFLPHAFLLWIVQFLYKLSPTLFILAITTVKKEFELYKDISVNFKDFFIYLL